MATSKNYGKKKVRIISGIFWTIMGKNQIMEKSDAGAACLSWTAFFFHNSVGYHILFIPVEIYRKGSNPSFYFYKSWGFPKYFQNKWI